MADEMGRSRGTGTTGYQAFRVEQRGIDLIPEAERGSTPTALFWMWAGAIFNVEFFFYGVLIMTFGLSLGQAFLAILVGNAFYLLLGVASLQGPLTGTTAFMISRAPFGRNGNRAVALFNWITQVGFETEGIYFIVATVILLFGMRGLALSGPEKVGVVVLVAAVQLLMPLFGHATITRMLRWLAYLFILLFLVLAGFVLTRLHLAGYHQHVATWAVWSTALVLIISVGGLGWTENANDYSRYLPRATPAHRTIWAATLGGAIPSILLEGLGVLAFTVTAKTVGIAQLGVPQAFPGGFVVPFLLFAIVQLFAINTIDVYSSGVTLQALGLRIKRWGAVFIDTTVGAVVTILILFHGNFYADFSGFLLYIVVWLGPWFGILMVDYLLRRGRYHLGSLTAVGTGVYWRRGGVHWPGLVAQALGMVAAMMWINAAFAVPSWVGPLSSHTGGSDFSWLVGIVVGGLVYLVLARVGVAREVAQGGGGEEAVAASPAAGSAGGARA